MLPPGKGQDKVCAVYRLVYGDWARRSAADSRREIASVSLQITVKRFAGGGGGGRGEDAMKGEKAGRSPRHGTGIGSSLRLPQTGYPLTGLVVLGYVP